MKKIILLYLIICNVAFCATAQTSDYSYYLEMALKRVETGECESAQRFYNVYAEISGKSNADVKTKIEECLKNESQPSLQDYVDLGLPSGTLWKKNDEEGLFSKDDALLIYGANIPSNNHWIELERKCTWTWTGNGYKVVGPNGNSLFFPTSGYEKCNGEKEEVGVGGHYWTSATSTKPEVWGAFFDSLNVSLTVYRRCVRLSVRLIYQKKI